jgi:hypothetical protein
MQDSSSIIASSTAVESRQPLYSGAVRLIFISLESVSKGDGMVKELMAVELQDYIGSSVPPWPAGFWISATGQGALLACVS